jgi:hypothetical protein
MTIYHGTRPGAAAIDSGEGRSIQSTRPMEGRASSIGVRPLFFIYFFCVPTTIIQYSSASLLPKLEFFYTAKSNCNTQNPGGRRRNTAH